MRLVRTRLGGGLFVSATAAITTLVVIACATGTDGGFVDGEGGIVETDGPSRDVNVLPGKDSSTPDDSGTLPGDDSSTGTCTKKVVINELLVNGTGEFIELYNPNTCAVPLGSWRIAYRSMGNAAGGASYTFGTGDSIAAKTFLVIGTTDFPGKKDATFNGGLGNPGGQVGLLDDKMGIVDAVGYGTGTSGLYTEGSPATLPPANGSIARKSDGVDTNDNNSDFKVSTPHTAGAPN